MTFNAGIIDYLKERNWPGNIRELQNLIERMLTLAPPETKNITPLMLPADIKSDFDAWRSNTSLTNKLSFNQHMFDFEKQLIINALDASDWNQSQAARLLCMSERNIRHKMLKLGIHRS